jgi:hypothetical protein
MKLLWLACVWVIWKERNNRVFNQKDLDIHQIIDNVKRVSFQWIKASLTTFAYSYTDMVVTPFTVHGCFIVTCFVSSYFCVPYVLRYL